MTDFFSRPIKYGPIATRHVYERMRSLQVGEAFTVERDEWPMPTPPQRQISRLPQDGADQGDKTSDPRPHSAVASDVNDMLATLRSLAVISTLHVAYSFSSP